MGRSPSSAATRQRNAWVHHTAMTVRRQARLLERWKLGSVEAERRVKAALDDARVPERVRHSWPCAAPSLQIKFSRTHNRYSDALLRVQTAESFVAVLIDEIIAEEKGK